MIVKDGEKFACDACIRGHRVSTCTHKDRKLNHVNKKGRPVSQCQHCRGLRKVRASHVKCDCGENGSKTITLDEESTSDLATCHCVTGKKCTCALKKEHTIAEDVLAPLQRSVSHQSKPVMPSHRSEGAVPRLRAAHHAPIHRNHAAHEHGQPYIVPKTRQMSSASEHTSDEECLANSLQTQYAYPMSEQQRSTSPLSQELSYATENMPTPRSRPRPPPLQSAQDSKLLSYPNLVPNADSTFLFNALSPGNPHRYSLNDFSMFTLDSVSQPQVQQSPSMLVVSTDPLDRTGMAWPTWDEAAAFDFDVNDPAFNPITPSDSVDHNIMLGPNLSRSSSGTISETEDFSAAQSDFSFDANAFAGLPVNWEMPNMLPELTTDAFDADFGSYINVSSDAPASMNGMIPTTTYQQPSYPLDQQQQQQQTSGIATADTSAIDAYLANANMNSTNFMQTSQQQSSFKDDEVRQWLTQDADVNGLAQMETQLDFEARDFGGVVQRSLSQSNVPSGQSQGMDFMGEQNWF